MLREPISGWEDDGMRGVLVGVYMGGSGLILKPVSGLLEFFSRSISGVGEVIRAFGDEVTRVPKTRIRSPRQFMSTGLATGTAAPASDLVPRPGKHRLAVGHLELPAQLSLNLLRGFAYGCGAIRATVGFSFITNRDSSS